MQTSAAVNFEQVLFRFGRNCLIRSQQFGWKRDGLSFAEGVPGEALLPDPAVGVDGSPAWP